MAQDIDPRDLLCNPDVFVSDKDIERMKKEQDKRNQRKQQRREERMRRRRQAAFVSDAQLMKEVKEEEDVDTKKADQWKLDRKWCREQWQRMTRAQHRDHTQCDKLCAAFWEYKQAEAQEQAARSLANFVKWMQQMGVIKKDF